MLELDRIYNMDCLKGIKQLDDDSVDIVFTDPPYNVGKDYGVSKDNLPDWKYIQFIGHLIIELQRVARKGYAFYVDWKHFQKYWKLLPDATPIIIYKKSTGNIKDEHGIMQHHHIILTNIKTSKQVKSIWDDVRVLGEGFYFREEKFNHPAQTTLKGTKKFIEFFTDEGDVVLDPFCGIGTTAVACKLLNRHFVGFELNEKFYNISLKRLLNQPEKLEKWLET